METTIDCYGQSIKSWIGKTQIYFVPVTTYPLFFEIDLRGVKRARNNELLTKKTTSLLLCTVRLYVL